MSGLKLAELPVPLAVAAAPVGHAPQLCLAATAASEAIPALSWPVKYGVLPELVGMERGGRGGGVGCHFRRHSRRLGKATLPMRSGRMPGSLFAGMVLAAVPS